MRTPTRPRSGQGLPSARFGSHSTSCGERTECSFCIFLSSRKSFENTSHLEIQVLGDKHGKNVINWAKGEMTISAATRSLSRKRLPTGPYPRRGHAMGEQASHSQRRSVRQRRTSGVRWSRTRVFFLEMNTRAWQVENPVTELHRHRR